MLEEGLVLKNGNKFIIKYSDKGEIIWAKQIEGVNINSGIPTIDGGLLIGGSFIGNIELENGTNFNARDKDGIIIKYEKSGKMEWARQIIGNNYDSITTIAQISNGSIVVGGNFFRPLKISFTI